MKKNNNNDHQNLHLVSKHFTVTIFRLQRLVAKTSIDFPLLLDVGGALTLLGVASKDS